MSRDVLRRVAVAVVGLVVFGGVATYLGLSYLGVVSRDVRVQATLPDLGDALGPGAKVRFHGIIVGRVVSVDRRQDGYAAELLVQRRHADTIPAGATARVLPSTLFGSEYVELVGKGVSAGPHLESGDVVKADTSASSVRLMESYDTADRLIRSLDVEQLTTATSRLAAALDGHGDDVGRFVERASSVLAAMQDDEDLFFGTLRGATRAMQVLDSLEPDAVSGARHTATTSRTVVAKKETIDRLLASSAAVATRAGRLLQQHADAGVALVNTSAGPMRTFAAHQADLRLILQRVPNVLHNGATAISDSAIVLEGQIGVDPMDPYTAADCPRYGALEGSNCDDAPAATPDDADTVGTIQGLLGDLASERKAPAADKPAPVPSPSATTSEPRGLDRLLHLLGLSP
jgi:virulence factor Mce-like protein